MEEIILEAKSHGFKLVINNSLKKLFYTGSTSPLGDGFKYIYSGPIYLKDNEDLYKSFMLSAEFAKFKKYFHIHEHMYKDNLCLKFGPVIMCEVRDRSKAYPYDDRCIVFFLDLEKKPEGHYIENLEIEMPEEILKDFWEIVSPKED